ncbi:MAG: hypothetical protein KBI47_12090 [Armatimonadetes bacterium]|nr:hypothetical protein [Armatimonadota bacterium]
MPKRDPREFPEMPSARHRKERPHLVDIIADETSGPAITDKPDKPGVPDKPGTPDTSDTPGKSDYKQTRQTKAGETVRRATFWLTDEDIEQIEALQRIVEVPGVPGIPDKSAVVREAIRRLATGGNGE